MEKIPTSSSGQFPEIVVSNSATSRRVSRAFKAGRLRRLASRLYTSNLVDDPEEVVRRNLWEIVAGYFPNALIADRTALENAPAEDGSVCLVAERGRNVQLPGQIVLRPRRGAGPLPSDRPFLNGLWLCSTARAYLENMRPSRTRGDRVRRTLATRQIEERLDTLIRRSGRDAINRLRDEIHACVRDLDMPEEGARLDALIGALQGSREARLHAPEARARRQGRPYDPERVALFQRLHTTLRQYPPVFRPVSQRTHEARQTCAFFESYFSNFIEGTRFEVEEARDIVFHQTMPVGRPEDAHDVLGTWHIVSDDTEMSRIPARFDEFMGLLKTRHAAIMERRRGMRPGEFKTRQNRAGGTVFVAPDLVTGTLSQGFDLYRGLETPFERAIFMLFLVTEVHPFEDGNGRVARIMMNAELVAAEEERVVLPTVYRDDYLTALKALSQGQHPDPLIRVVDYLQRWTAALAWRDLEETRRDLEECNAFLEPAEADRRGRRLRMPGGFDEPDSA